VCVCVCVCLCVCACTHGLALRCSATSLIALVATGGSSCLVTVVQDASF